LTATQKSRVLFYVWTFELPSPSLSSPVGAETCYVNGCKLMMTRDVWNAAAVWKGQVLKLSLIWFAGWRAGWVGHSEVLPSSSSSLLLWSSMIEFQYSAHLSRLHIIQI
jgi:hypothetical protein